MEKQRISFQIETYELKNKMIDEELVKLQSELKEVANREVTDFNIGLLESIATKMKNLLVEKSHNNEFICCLKAFVKEA